MSDSAAAAKSTEPTAPRQTYILFTVAGTTYGIVSQHVLHIEMVEHVTPVPNAPAFVEGVVFSRGQVVPVINLRSRFGFDRQGLDIRTRLLVVEQAGRRVGLLADEAREFVSLATTAIHPPNDAISGTAGRYLDGVAVLGDRIVLILDIREVVQTTPMAAA
jgi:purine-binding chemotaxis protein CheW